MKKKTFQNLLEKPVNALIENGTGETACNFIRSLN